jgi:hypothetical protein
MHSACLLKSYTCYPELLNFMLLYGHIDFIRDNFTFYIACCGPGSSVGITTDYGLDGPGSNPGGDEIFLTCPERPWGPPSLLKNGYRVFPGGKMRPERAADYSPPSSAAVMEE